MPNFRQRKWLWIAMAIAIIVIVTLVAAPNSKGDSGSTYGHNPDGYGAWYEYMSRQEVPIKRWQKPFSRFLEKEHQGVTYIQISSKERFFLSHFLSESEENWVGQGNTLVIIGKHEPVTAAPFKSLIPLRDQTLSSRQIIIETTRRHDSENEIESLLKDNYGTVVWSEKIDQGEVIYCVTPYLAANAYQNTQQYDNFEFLAEIVSQNKAIWVDEYIHGYKDKETIVQEEQEDVLSYLAKTPLLLLFIQTLIIVSVAAAAAFRRFGKPLIPQRTVIDNSTAYIDALAGVLEKANSIDFVIDNIGKDEQRKLQASLGLGKSLVEDDTLIAAWKQQKQQPVSELTQLLKINHAKSKISEAQLISWIQKWQKINS